MNLKQKRLVVCMLLNWFEKRGRSFPWRKTKDPYKIFIAETLLQKTNVEKALPAYLTIIKRYPTIKALSKAHIRDLRRVIASLGLIKRALFLKMGALYVTKTLQTKFPANVSELKRII